MSTTTQTRTVRASSSSSLSIHQALALTAWIMALFTAGWAFFTYPFDILGRIWPGLTAMAMLGIFFQARRREDYGIALLMWAGLLFMALVV